jgi:hypothetical protein
VVQRQPIRRHRRRRRRRRRTLVSFPSLLDVSATPPLPAALCSVSGDLAKCLLQCCRPTMGCVLYIGGRQARALCTHARK